MNSFGSLLPEACFLFVCFFFLWTRTGLMSIIVKMNPQQNWFLDCLGLWCKTGPSCIPCFYLKTFSSCNDDLCSNRTEFWGPWTNHFTEILHIYVLQINRQRASCLDSSWKRACSHASSWNQNFHLSHIYKFVGFCSLYRLKMWRIDVKSTILISRKERCFFCIIIDNLLRSGLLEISKEDFLCSFFF